MLRKQKSARFYESKIVEDSTRAEKGKILREQTYMKDSTRADKGKILYESTTGKAIIINKKLNDIK
jgi:hypothetical protein